MKIFDYLALDSTFFDMDVVGYIGSIREYKGRQDLYIQERPNQLSKLIVIAKIQSTDSSNAIEGIRTTSTRLKSLFEDKTTPKNRDEEEIVGYRDVLNTIHENYEYISITKNYILQLHKILYSHSPKNIGGKFKSVQNYINGISDTGESYTIFTPLPPHETADAIDRICTEYNNAISSGVEPLILIPIFIHDFLCIHPFLDGNGRMSRLLTTLLLYKSGYIVGKYISLEGKIADNKTGYYSALYKSGQGWHESSHNQSFFTKYLLGTILSAYRDFEDRCNLISNAPSSLDTVKNAIELKIGKFTKKQIQELCPHLSSSSVEGSIKKLTDTGILTKHGSGRATFYTRNS